MDEKITSKIATKLITRSKTKTSKSHKKIVAMLNNLSKDKSGAPVKWKFNKSGVKQANKVGKRLATAEEKDLTSQGSLPQSTIQKKETKNSKPTDVLKKSDNKDSKTEEITGKRKPGRPKIVKPEKQLNLTSVSSIASIERLNDNKVVELSTEKNEQDDDSISIGLNSSLYEKPDLSLSEGNTHKTGLKQGKRKTILSKNIRIKRLEILKRHMERGKGKGRSGLKRIREYHSTTPVSDINLETLPDEMNDQSTVSNNQDKLKILKEQIDSERRRGRGRGNLRRGRGRGKSLQVSDVDESSSSFSAGSSQYQDVHAGDDSILKTEATQLGMLKLRVEHGNSNRGRRGRPKWKHLNIGNRTNKGISDTDSFSAKNQNQIGSSEGRSRASRGRGPMWTSLNRQTLNKLVLNEHTKQALCSGTLSLVNQLNDNNLIDSENESVDSNLSSVSSKARKRKKFHHSGIKLGPAKLLRSQDSMKTRNFKDLNTQRVPTKRKRTLSGEFELLDEVSLRKQMRGKDDDDSSTIRSFDDSWADMTDSELTDSRLDFTKGEYEQKNDSGNKCTKIKTKSDETLDRDDLEKRKVILNEKMKSKESLKEKDVKVVRKKGRPPKIRSKKYETEVKVNKKDFVNTKHPFISRNTTGRLTIIGPGGKYFVKIKNQPSDDNEIILGNELDGVGVNENVDTDRGKDTAVKELKEEVKIEDIKDDYTKDNEVVIKVVIENSEIIDSLEKQESSVQPTKREDNVSIQSIDNTKEDYSMETENTRETINMSLKHVTHEDNHDNHDNKDTLNSKDQPLKQSENLDRADSRKNIDSEQQSELKSLKIQDSVLMEKSRSVEISLKECNNDSSSRIKSQNLANELEKDNPSDENITGKNDSAVNKCEVENKIEEKMEFNVEISVEDAHCVNNVASVDTNEVSSASNLGRSTTSKAVNQSEPPPVTNGDEIKNLSIDEQVLHQGNSEQLENNRPDVVESEKHVSSLVSVAKLDNTELNEPSDHNVKGTESVVMEVLEHVLVNVCGKLDSNIVNDVQGPSPILGNDEEKTELSGTNIDFKESLTDSKIVSEVPSMPDQIDNEGINKVNMENNPELTLEKSEEEKLVQRDVNAEENKDKRENDMAAINSDRTEINISEKPGQSFFTEPSDDIVLNNKLKETCDNDLGIDSIEIKNQEEKNDCNINMVEASNKETEALELESKENREDEIHSKTVEIVVNDTEADENVGTSGSLMDESTPMEPETCDPQVKRKRKKELESDSKSAMLEPELQDSNTASPETFGKTETKRVFQLRKKASRSPLEIIAMKHSMEERQYMLEETQRAIRREEKQKKMFQNKLLRQTIEQLSPPKQTEHVSPPKPILEHVESVSPEKLEVFTLEPINQCRPCSVVLIDFVKYLKMNENSEKCDTVPDLDELSTSEEEPMTESESSEKSELDMNKDTNLIDDTNVMLDSTLNEVADNATPSLPQGIPPPIKRPATARKQAKSYNYSAKLTAEIVSSPEPTESGSKSFMVPPLRLKIKQKEKGKRRYKGHKWTASRNKARKQMSPTKRLIPREQFEFETLGLKEGDYDISPTPDKVVKLDGMIDVSNGKTVSDPSTSENSAVTNFQTPLDGNNLYRFKCSDKNCDFKSQMRNIMESHIYIHINDVPFKCFHCELIYSNRNMAFNHSKKIHPDKEPKIIAVVPVEESNFYEEINVPQGADNSNVIQADIQDVQHSSESLIISVRLPRNINDSSTGCFCCCHCDYSSSKVPDINAHVEERHRELIQYHCSVCNEAVYRHGEGIAKHFSVEHPDQPVAYKSLPDFYDVRKTIEKSLTNGDKGNIFERMSDLFAGKKNRGKGSKSNSVPEKTSAEADSTTMETDEEMAAATTQQNTPVGGKTVVPVHREPDGIEQLAQMFGSSSSNEMGRCTTDSNRNSSSGEKNTEDNNGNDMGLKIVEVVSLQGGSDFAKNVWGEPATIGKLVPPYSSQMPIQAVHRPPILVPTSALQSVLQSHRPILPMPQRIPSSQSANIDAAKLKEMTTTYKCEKCNVHAPVLSAMVEHLRTGHKDIPRLFLCPFCRQYEGATEPDIHKHIKQFHPSPDTRSPPVALSSDAKQHLRTIEVPIGDTQKVNGKYLIEKNIYKCLKCKRHMPSLDYIYEHLEKEHNEVFVYVCPDCKRFRAKEEEVVFNHIKTVHNKNTDDIILSLAIEENLFTKVQCLIKDKHTQNKAPLQKQIPPPLTSQQGIQGRQMQDNAAMLVAQNRPQAQRMMPVYHQRPPMQPLRAPMQPVFPGMIQNQPVRMPGPAMASMPMHAQSNIKPPPVSNPPMNKSAMRKSRPVHIPQQQQNMDHVATSHTVQHLPSDGRRISSPPPLMRGPPPLIRFQDNQSISQASSHPVQSSAAIRSANFSMSDKVHRLHPHSQSHSLAMNSSPPPPQGRPVLKVPSVPIRRTSPTLNEGRQTTEGGAPLDLSRTSTPNSQPDTSEDIEDMSPDAFQIFNLQPVRPPQAPQMRPTHFSQMHNMQPQRVQQLGQYNPNMYNRPGMYSPMYSRPPPPYTQTLNQGPRPQSPKLMSSNQVPSQPALFKCPYCTSIVPLSMGEVAPHIKKFHPGQTVQFVKKD